MGGNEELKNAGLKVTAPRRKILSILKASTDEHLSAEEIYKILLDQGEEIGLATVYRVLTQFESTGLVTRHRFGDHSVFELNTGEHHDHIVCTCCGRIEEFLDAEIERLQDKVALKLGFTLTNHSLYLYGICGTCR